MWQAFAAPFAAQLGGSLGASLGGGGGGGGLLGPPTPDVLTSTAEGATYGVNLGPTGGWVINFGAGSVDANAELRQTGVPPTLQTAAQQVAAEIGRAHV